MAGLLVSFFAVPSVHPDFPFTSWAVTSWVCPYFSSGGAPTGTYPYYCLHFPFPGPDLKGTAICLLLLQDSICFCIYYQK